MFHLRPHHRLPSGEMVVKRVPIISKIKKKTSNYCKSFIRVGSGAKFLQCPLKHTYVLGFCACPKSGPFVI